MIYIWYTILAENLLIIELIHFNMPELPLKQYISVLLIDFLIARRDAIFFSFMYAVCKNRNLKLSDCKG